MLKKTFGHICMLDSLLNQWSLLFKCTNVILGTKVYCQTVRHPASITNVVFDNHILEITVKYLCISTNILISRELQI